MAVECWGARKPSDDMRSTPCNLSRKMLFTGVMRDSGKDPARGPTCGMSRGVISCVISCVIS
eukprot:2744537-Rhodomonas_salina.2